MFQEGWVLRGPLPCDKDLVQCLIHGKYYELDPVESMCAHSPLSPGGLSIFFFLNCLNIYMPHHYRQENDVFASMIADLCHSPLSSTWCGVLLWCFLFLLLVYADLCSGCLSWSEILQTVFYLKKSPLF